MHKIYILSFVAFAAVTISCKENTETRASTEKQIPVEKNNGNGSGAPTLEEAFRQNIERAHHKQQFLEQPAIAFDLDINFNDTDRFDARITMLTNTGKIHMDKPDGSSLIYTGEKAYLSPKTAVDGDARFNMFTWPYFFALPYKLDDPGTNFVSLGKKQFDGQERDTYKLTFENGTGDTPEDWYIIYLNENQSVHAAAYIVTFGGKEQNEAEENPHCIVYKDYAEVQGVPIATSWGFYNWSEEKGLLGDPIGQATLSNVNFLTPSPNLFVEPESSMLIK